MPRRHFRRVFAYVETQIDTRRTMSHVTSVRSTRDVVGGDGVQPGPVGRLLSERTSRRACSDPRSRMNGIYTAFAVYNAFDFRCDCLPRSHLFSFVGFRRPLEQTAGLYGRVSYRKFSAKTYENTTRRSSLKHYTFFRKLFAKRRAIKFDDIDAIASIARRCGIASG